MIYNKLVRDKIPEIIAKSGKKAKVRTLQGEELKRALKCKLVEEANELLYADTEEEIIEEIADVLEVLGLLQVKCVTPNCYYKVERMQDKKNRQKGRFDKGYFLESVEEVENGN